jgi:flagellar hook-length control protein FliK
MIDLSSLAAPMANPVTTGGGPSTLSDLAGSAKIGNGSTTAPGSGNATASAHPSTDGFMQVLDLFLGGSPLPSTLLASTAITQTPPTSDFVGAAKTLDTGALLAGKLEDERQPQDLDAATAERIASVLQMLGFQVKPAEIQELSPLDREQLGTALEFVQRNLQKGASPGAIAENATMLLPRPWPLDDADGTPMGTTDTATATDSHSDLPADFIETLSDLRSKIGESLGHAPSAQSASNRDSGVVAAPVAESPSTSYDGSAQTGSEHGDRPSSKGDRAANAHEAIAATVRKPGEQNLSEQWNHNLQQAATAVVEDEPQTDAVPRHLTPGGTTSELIGRQVLEKVHVQLNEGHREVRLRLWPEELGEVRLSLKMTDGEKVHANMVVENDAVRQAMLDATPQLKDALARHGLDLERLSVSVNQRNPQEAGTDARHGEDGRRQGSRNGRGNGGWNEATVDVEQEVVLGEDTGRRNGRNTIDLWS